MSGKHKQLWLITNFPRPRHGHFVFFYGTVNNFFCLEAGLAIKKKRWGGRFFFAVSFPSIVLFWFLGAQIKRKTSFNHGRCLFAGSLDNYTVFCPVLFLVFLWLQSLSLSVLFPAFYGYAEKETARKEKRKLCKRCPLTVGDLGLFLHLRRHWKLAR